MKKIFFDKNPREAAKMCDDNLEEMIIYCSDILSSSIHLSRSRADEYTKDTKTVDDNVKWLTKSISHWKWVWLFGHHLGNRYSQLNKDIHDDTRTLRCLPLPTKIRKNGWVDPPVMG